MRPARRRNGIPLMQALLAAALILLPLGAGASLAAAADEEPGVPVTVTVPERGQGVDEPFTVSNAQFRWGLNPEAGSPAFFGGCNFLSAGIVGDTGGSAVWTAADGHYASRAGQVTIERPVLTSGGAPRYLEVPFADRCKDPQGGTLSISAGNVSGVQAVIDGGTGRVDPAAGEATISWDGAFTTVFYGGLTYWWVSELELTITDGKGRLTGLVSGYGADREDTSVWELLPTRRVTLATLDSVSLTGARGFATLPAYRGVTVSPGAGEASQLRSGGDWGSFPQDFITFQSQTGQSGFWYSTGGVRDPYKPRQHPLRQL